MRAVWCHIPIGLADQLVRLNDKCDLHSAVVFEVAAIMAKIEQGLLG